MNVITQCSEMTEKIRELKAEGKKIGFVPTMGALHEGHLSLMRIARMYADVLVVSIFVNPKQFAPHEDFSSYPRKLDIDIREIESVGGDAYVFAPTEHQMYPPEYSTWVRVEGITERMEGAMRPGHFRGVCTVVLKLFTIVSPHFAVFGQKDAQQVAVIRRMVRDLALPIEIVVGPIVRENDGLALSSRNVYLSPEERKRASIIFKGLCEAKKMFDNGERRAQSLVDCVEKIYAATDILRTEYIECCNIDSLRPIRTIDMAALLAVACRTTQTNTRLIDNMELQSNERENVNG